MKKQRTIRSDKKSEKNFEPSVNKARESNLLDSESSSDSMEEEEEVRHTGTTMSSFAMSRTNTRGSHFNKSAGDRSNRLSFSLGYRTRSDSVTKKKRKDYVLPGAKITAYSTSIFTRLRILDGIDFHQIKQSLDPRSNRE